MYHSFNKSIWLAVKESHFVSEMNFFVKLSFILSQLLLSRTESPKCSTSIILENYDHVTMPFVLVYQFRFHVLQCIRPGFLKSLRLSYDRAHNVLTFIYFTKFSFHYK